MAQTGRTSAFLYKGVRLTSKVARQQPRNPESLQGQSCGLQLCKCLLAGISARESNNTTGTQLAKQNSSQEDCAAAANLWGPKRIGAWPLHCHTCHSACGSPMIASIIERFTALLTTVTERGSLTDVRTAEQAAPPICYTPPQGWGLAAAPWLPYRRPRCTSAWTAAAQVQAVACPA